MRSVFAATRGVGVDGAGKRQPIKHAVAGGPRRFRVAVGAARFGRLGQGDEERGFGGGQARRLLAEVGEARGADAFDVAAVGRERQVEREDLVLGELRSSFRAMAIWRSLPAIAARAAIVDQPRDLHGQRRAAGDDVAAGEDELPRLRGPAPRASTPSCSAKRRSS